MVIILILVFYLDIDIKLQLTLHIISGLLGFITGYYFQII